MINQLKHEDSILLLRETLDVPRSALDQHPRLPEDQSVRDALREWAGEWPTYGYRRLTRMLHRQGHPVHTKRVRRRMHAMGICGAAPYAAT
jgi:putative transposase